MGKQSQPAGQYQGQGGAAPNGQDRGNRAPLPYERPGFGGLTAFGNVGDAAEFLGLSAPDTPDYMGAADKTAMGSRPDINTPFGGQHWTHNPDGTWTLTQGFGGPMSGVGDALGGQAMDQLGKPLDLGSLGPMVDPTKARQDAIDAAYGQAKSRLDPMYDQREAALRQRLANQGLDPNSEAGQKATAQLGQERNDAYGSAMNSAIMQGTQAGESMFRQGLAGRQQLLSEMLRQRDLPLDEMMMLQRLLQMPATPGGPDYLGATGMQGQYDLGAWGQETGNKADTIKGGGDLLGSLLSLFGL